MRASLANDGTVHEHWAWECSWPHNCHSLCCHCLCHSDLCSDTTAGFTEHISDKRWERNGYKGAKGFFHSTSPVCLDAADRVTENIQAQTNKVNCDSNRITVCANKVEESDASFTRLSSWCYASMRTAISRIALSRLTKTHSLQRTSGFCRRCD